VTCRLASARSPKRKAWAEGWLGMQCIAEAAVAPPRRSLARPSRDPGQPKLCACETCRQRLQGSRDSRLGLDQLGRRSGRFPGQPTTHVPADLDRNRKGALSPPRSYAQPLDVARERVTVAGRRRCRASGRVRPCWDPAYPCCSRLGWASGPVAASRPSEEHPPAGGPALLGSTVRWYPSPTWGHGHGASGECSPHGGRAHDGAVAASPRLCLRPKVEVRPYCTASDQAHRDWGRVHLQRFRPMDWLVAPRLARKAQARQSPQHRSRDALFSSVTSDDDYFGRPLVGAVHTSDQRPRQPRPAHGKSETARCAGRRNQS
jgi:hypothetical protein